MLVNHFSVHETVQEMEFSGWNVSFNFNERTGKVCVCVCVSREHSANGRAPTEADAEAGIKHTLEQSE